MENWITELKEKKLGKILENVVLKNYTTYKIGGTAKVMIFPKNIEDLVELIKYIKIKNIKYFVLGNGSNVIFSDKEFDGIIIKLDCFDDIEIKKDVITAGAGASLMKTALKSAREGLTGLEFATGIPGTVGGAVYMNAGAYKSDMGYVVKKVQVLTPDLKVITMVNKELDFHYRTSFLKRHKGYICLQATIKLQKGNKDLISEVITERKKRRVESQPLEYPSAGSVFRNPKDMFAGKLIEDLGLKGLIKGGAQISNKHANFIVNIGNANAQDVYDLIHFVKETVKQEYDIELKEEQEFVNWE